jgi:hypothetical protein
LKLLDLFQHATVEALGAFIDQGASAPAPVELTAAEDVQARRHALGKRRLAARAS